MHEYLLGIHKHYHKAPESPSKTYATMEFPNAQLEFRNSVFGMRLCSLMEVKMTRHLFWTHTEYEWSLSPAYFISYPSAGTALSPSLYVLEMQNLISLRIFTLQSNPFFSFLLFLIVSPSRTSCQVGTERGASLKNFPLDLRYCTSFGCLSSK